MLGANKRVLPLLHVMEKVKCSPQQRGTPGFPPPTLETVGSQPNLLHPHPTLLAPTPQHTQNAHHVPEAESIKWLSRFTIPRYTVNYFVTVCFYQNSNKATSCAWPWFGYYLVTIQCVHEGGWVNRYVFVYHGLWGRGSKANFLELVLSLNLAGSGWRTQYFI